MIKKNIPNEPVAKLARGIRGSQALLNNGTTLEGSQYQPCEAISASTAIALSSGAWPESGAAGSAN